MVVLREIKRMQDEKVAEIDLVTFTGRLQSDIITNVLFGTKYAEKLVPFENDDGSMSQESISGAIEKNMRFMITERAISPLFLLFPSLMKHHITPRDRMYSRNRQSVYNVLYEIVQERKKNKDGEGDVLDLFLSEEIYNTDDWKIVYELKTML